MAVRNTVRIHLPVLLPIRSLLTMIVRSEARALGDVPHPPSCPSARRMTSALKAIVEPFTKDSRAKLNKIGPRTKRSV